MKLLTPKQLHRMYVKEHYDIEVAYLEGPAARIISGCSDPDTRLVTWIHCTMKSEREFALGFRSFDEAKRCYARFDRSIFVSRDVRKAFAAFCPTDTMTVCYNTNETAKMLELCREEVEPGLFSAGEIHLIGTGKLTPVKGFDRLARIHSRLRSAGYPVHTWILGIGEEEQKLRMFARENGIEDSFTLLGYQTNPYKYVSKCDLFVCASHSEGFSTAATEALIVGTPVCTVEVSGMKEMLGANNEYGLVTENDEEALYQGIKKLLDDPVLLTHYKKQAALRGRDFSTEETVRAVEEMLIKL
jgi:glycosyltransferase involved in cell wall biosynthesis